MNVLVVSATEFELASFIQESSPADILITGIGIPATIFNLTKKLFQKNYDLVIQAGICGTFTADLEKGNVVMIKKDAFGDIGIEENGNYKTLFDVGFMNANDVPYSDGWLVNRHEYIANSHLPAVNAITVNKISDDAEQVKKLSEKFNPSVESMEGAALHYVCLRQKINFLQLTKYFQYSGRKR